MDYNQFQEEVNKCKTTEDIVGKNGLVQRLVKDLLEQVLEKELEEHLGYEKHSSQGDRSGNSRNGKTKKMMDSSFGPIELETPRDRNSSFEPQVVKKRQTSISSFDDKIISLYAKGMSTRDIQSHVKDIYGADISPAMVSTITDKVLEVAKEWQNRYLQKIYAIAYFDAIHYKVRVGNKVVTKACYTCIAIDLEGKKDILGLWIGESEGAKFWLNIFAELKNRGIQDIFIACIDGLKGLPEAISAIFPQTTVQLCVIHMIRNSIKYIPHKHSKEFMADLKAVYQAPTEDAGKIALNALVTKWKERYPMSCQNWENHWEHVCPFYNFPPAIRRIMYTTNAVEALHRQFRKVTKTKAVFPTDDALFKSLYLAVRDLSEKWTMPIREWKEAISYFAITFAERIID